MLFSDPVADYDEADSSGSDDDDEMATIPNYRETDSLFTVDLKRPIDKPSLILLAIGEYASLFVETVLLGSDSQEVGTIRLQDSSERSTESGRLFELSSRKEILICCIKIEPKAEHCVKWLATFTAQFAPRESVTRPIVIVLSSRPRCELREALETETDELRRFETVTFSALRAQSNTVEAAVESIKVAHSVTGLAAQVLAFGDCFGLPVIAFWLFTAAESPFAIHVSFSELFNAFRRALDTLHSLSTANKTSKDPHVDPLCQAASLGAFALDRFALGETRERIERVSREFAKRRAIAVQRKQQIYS